MGRSLKAFSRRPLLDAFPGGLQQKVKFIQFSVVIWLFTPSCFIFSATLQTVFYFYVLTFCEYYNIAQVMTY